MNTYDETINKFSNYLHNNSKEDERKQLIDKVLSKNNVLLFMNLLRPEDDTENKIITEKDRDGNVTTYQQYSQVREFIKVFGLENNVETYNKLKEYLNELLVYTRRA